MGFLGAELETGIQWSYLIGQEPPREGNERSRTGQEEEELSKDLELLQPDPLGELWSINGTP